MNGRRNPRMMAALIFHYLKEGNTNRANYLINSSQKFLDADGIKLLKETIFLFESNGNLQSLLGPFYYEPILDLGRLCYCL